MDIALPLHDLYHVDEVAQGRTIAQTKYVFLQAKECIITNDVTNNSSDIPQGDQPSAGSQVGGGDAHLISEAHWEHRPHMLRILHHLRHPRCSGPSPLTMTFVAVPLDIDRFACECWELAQPPHFAWSSVSFPIS